MRIFKEYFKMRYEEEKGKAKTQLEYLPRKWKIWDVKFLGKMKELTWNRVERLVALNQS